MFSGGWKLCRLGSFEIYIHPSWFLIFAFITFVLSQIFMLELTVNSLFPLPVILGAITAILIFVCGIIHELAHSIVGKKFGIPFKKITLFMLGLMAHMPKLPEKAKHEFLIALAGPVTSFAIAAILYYVTPIPITFLIQKFSLFATPLILAYMVITKVVYFNVVLGIFNLIPAFPLDGGRMLRSLIEWFITKDRLKATKIAVAIGKTFAILMGIFGLISFHIWFILIAAFIWFSGTKELRMLIYQEEQKDLNNGGL
ncbi:site-2 protease family protein [Patescibacteria group bacterium AH-259-L05]|nr:site-2 protease family protein [Patescibacteria group bacterium AH-259-L05]